MFHSHGRNYFSLLYATSFVITCLGINPGDMVNNKVLYVGNELWKETLPLRSGSCLYSLDGLKSYTWYEVKISYPASIPAIFSLQLEKGSVGQKTNQLRRLLNTEKLIFKTDSLDKIKEEGGLFVLVTVEPEGYVAIPNVEERHLIVYNIVCDELLLGIPYRAWWVVILVILCIGVAISTPKFLPSYLLPKTENMPNIIQNVSKDS